MILKVICDRCKNEIEPETATRMGASSANGPMDLIHIPGYDGDYAERFAYIDLCPECADKFHKFMKGEEKNAE